MKNKELYVCSCNLNSEKNEEEDNELVEDDGNFLSYLLDNINYQVFKCYKLFFNFKNLKKSNPFYIILIIFIILLIIDFLYICYTLEKLKLFLAKELFKNNSINNEIILESKKLDDAPKINIEEYANPTKKNNQINKKKKKNSKKNDKKTEQKDKNDITKGTKSEKKLLICVVDPKFLDQKIKPNKNSSNIKKSNKKNQTKIEIKKGMGDELIKKKIKEEKPKEEQQKEEKLKEGDINELPFSKAIRIDDRNIFRIFYSFIIEKFDLINIMYNDYYIKTILFAEYILGLLINFFFNALLYTDDVVSNKYHNNGELDIIVTLTLSIVSNIVSSIFCYYIKYTRGIEERIDLIIEIKYKKEFFRNIKRLFLYLKIKFICFFISQLLILAACVYYIVIFCILYSRSQKSLIVNFCYSLVESIITSFGLALIILITRKIGLSCQNKELYNTSKFINAKF